MHDKEKHGEIFCCCSMVLTPAIFVCHRTFRIFFTKSRKRVMSLANSFSRMFFHNT